MPYTKKLEVSLTDEDRSDLEALCRKGIVAASKLRHARILLMADEDRREGRRPDWYIAEVVGLSERQVVRVRQKFFRDGLLPALERKKRLTPPNPPRFDGAAEAKLITLCCSDPPEGQQRWTLQLLVDELCRLKVVVSVCPETVRKCLKKIVSNPGRRNGSVFLSETMRGSWPIWRNSSTSTAKRMTKSIR